MSTRYRIKGMTCGGCARAVTNAIRGVAAGARVDVDLPAGVVTVDAAVGEAAIAKAITEAGFEFAGRA